MYSNKVMFEDLDNRRIEVRDAGELVQKIREYPADKYRKIEAHIPLLTKITEMLSQYCELFIHLSGTYYSIVYYEPNVHWSDMKKLAATFQKKYYIHQAFLTKAALSRYPKNTVGGGRYDYLRKCDSMPPQEEFIEPQRLGSFNF